MYTSKYLGATVWGKWQAPVLGAVTVLFFVQSLALAGELWIPPAKNDQNTEVGNWAVAQLRGNVLLGAFDETHFGFHVPANLTAFTKAILVLIPPQNGTLNYNLNLSVAKPGEQHDFFTKTQAGLSAAVTAGQLTEIDVSTIFVSPSPAPLTAGESYVSLNLVLPTRSDVTQVLGLRFQYAGSAGGGGSADADMLDGLDSTQFLRSDTNGTLTGNLSVTGYIRAGNSVEACTAAIVGASRFNTGSLSLEVCDGTQWKALAYQ